MPSPIAGPGSNFHERILEARANPSTAIADVNDRIRCVALAILATQQQLRAVWDQVSNDTSWRVRRLAAEHAAHDQQVDVHRLAALLRDTHPLVVEASAYALGERGEASVVTDLVETAAHEDPVVREASIAALGAIGAPGGRAAVLAAMKDKPAIRRRATCALAAFEGYEVESALEAARNDRDWQVRQIAEAIGGADPA